MWDPLGAFLIFVFIAVPLAAIVAEGLQGADMTHYWRDLIERVFSTWAEAFLGLLLASELFDVDHVDRLDTLEQAAVAAIPAALAVLKGAVASRVGNRNTASLTD